MHCLLEGSGVGYVPLYDATSSTLLALTLTTLPLLYFKLVLKNETDATLILQKLVERPPLATSTMSCTICLACRHTSMARLPDARCNFKRLIHPLSLHRTSQWRYDSNTWKDLGNLQSWKGFLSILEEKCPDFKFAASISNNLRTMMMSHNLRSQVSCSECDQQSTESENRALHPPINSLDSVYIRPMSVIEALISGSLHFAAPNLNQTGQ